MYSQDRRTSLLTYSESFHYSIGTSSTTSEDKCVEVDLVRTLEESALASFLRLPEKHTDGNSTLLRGYFQLEIDAIKWLSSLGLGFQYTKS